MRDFIQYIDHHLLYMFSKLLKKKTTLFRFGTVYLGEYIGLINLIDCEAESIKYQFYVLCDNFDNGTTSL